MKLQIANLIFQLNLELQTLPESFEPFICHENKTPDFKIEPSNTDLSTIDYSPLKQFDWFQSVCTLFYNSTDDKYIWLRVDTITKEKEYLCWSSNNPTLFKIKTSCRQYVIEHFLLIAFTYAALPYQTLVIHSSVIQFKDRAYMFLGESGTGKSTHTKLWLQNIENAIMINDDAPVVRIINGKAIVFGSPWSGKGRVFRNVALPLAATCRLKQAPENKITNIKPQQAFASIYPSAMPSLALNEQHTDKVFETISDIINSASHYNLSCLPNDEAAILSCQTMSVIVNN